MTLMYDVAATYNTLATRMVVAELAFLDANHRTSVATAKDVAVLDGKADATAETIIAALDLFPLTSFAVREKVRSTVGKYGDTPPMTASKSRAAWFANVSGEVADWFAEVSN